MTQKEQLWENYEDAVFAILMDAVAEQEGEKGLQLMEELEHDPSAQVPEEVQKKGRKDHPKSLRRQKPGTCEAFYLQGRAADRCGCASSCYHNSLCVCGFSGDTNWYIEYNC